MHEQNHEFLNHIAKKNVRGDIMILFAAWYVT